MLTVRKKGSPFLAGAIFFIIGLGALAGGIIWGFRTQRFVSSAERADGIVTDLDMRSDSDGSAYYPVVSFTTKEGKEVTFTSSTGGNPPPKRRGAEVEVLYDAANPEEAEINSFFALWFGPLLVGGLFGTLFPLIGAFAMIGGLRDRATRRRLRENGQRIVAEVQGIEGPSAGFAGWTVLARATDQGGIQRIFRSAPIAKDPSAAMAGRKSVDVIVDPGDYGTYEIDLAFIQNMPSAGTVPNR